MSQYLSRFYCGNKEGLCNFTQPIEYNKLLNRQFDNTLVEVVQQCEGPGKEKGYCCPKNDDSNKLITTSDLENINQIAGGEIFKRDEHGNVFKGQVPLVKVNKEGDHIKSIDICDCGGNKKDFQNCVKKNCKDFKHPTKYEYCKMGDMSNLYGCYGNNQNSCKVGNTNPESQYMYSHRLRIKNLYPDCYLNLCNKSNINGSLDNTSSNTYEQTHYVYNNDVNSKFPQSIDNYLLNKDVSTNKNTNNIQDNSVNKNKLTIEDVLFN